MKKILPKDFIKNVIVEIGRIEWNRETITRIVLSFLLLIGLVEPFIAPSKAQAAEAYVMYVPDRMTAASDPTGSICINRNSTMGTGTSSVTITFPSSYTIDTTLANWALNTTSTNIPGGTTQWPTTTSGNATAASNSTKAVTWTTGDLTSATTTYCLHFTATGGVSRSGSAANNLTGTIATNILTPGNQFAVSLVGQGADQIIVTATVSATFSFSLSASTSAFSTNLPTSGSPATSIYPIAMTISTNAANGWTSWVKDANANGLTSALSGDHICFNYPSTCTAYVNSSGNVVTISSIPGYGLSAAAGSGSPTIAAPYAGSSTAFGVLNNGQFEQLSSMTGPVSGAVTNLTFGAEASATNKAAPDYTDTVTVIAAGQF